MLRTFQDRTNSCLKHGIDRTWAAMWKTNAAHASQATVYSLAGRWTWLCTAPMCRRRFRSILLFFLSYNLPLILSLVFTKFLTYSLDLLDFFLFPNLSCNSFSVNLSKFLFFFLFVNFVNSGQGFVTRSESPKLWAAILISLRFERDQEFKMCSLHGFHKQHTVVVYTKLKGKKQYIQH